MTIAIIRPSPPSIPTATVRCDSCHQIEFLSLASEGIARAMGEKLEIMGWETVVVRSSDGEIRNVTNYCPYCMRNGK